MAIEMLAATPRASISYGSPTVLRNLSKMSMSAWIRPFSGGGNGLGRIISKEPGYVFYLGGTGGTALQFGINRTGGTYNIVTSSSLLTVAANAPWQHVAVVWSGGFTTSAFKLYINGISRNISESSIGSGTQVDDSANNFCIGNRQIPNNDRAFDGRIADVAVWDNALTAEEILSLSKRYACRYVAPHALTFYCPLIRSLSPVNETDSPSLTSVTIVDHPPIIL